MPELPEMTVISGQMNQEIVGKDIAEVEVNQPKILNLPFVELKDKIVGQRVLAVRARGKWLFLELSNEWSILINLGMGGDLLFFASGEALPSSYKFKIGLCNGSGFTISFWWFGYVHAVNNQELNNHKMTSDLGLSPLDIGFTLGHFRNLLSSGKEQVKSFLLNQRKVAGIGNVYVQDILFGARLHPKRKINSLTEKETKDLYDSMREILLKSVKLGGLAYEKDFYGKNGGFSGEEFLVGYKTGKPCPVCGTSIEKIKTGNTSSYICQRCQR